MTTREEALQALESLLMSAADGGENTVADFEAGETIREALGASGWVEPDWGEAPRSAKAWAIDESGMAYWYSVEGLTPRSNGEWGKPGGGYMRTPAGAAMPCPSWRKSLRIKPVEGSS